VLASLAYGNLALRPFGDLDLLVRQADVFRALELLHVHGYRSALDQTAPGGRRGSAIPGQYACRFEAGDVLVEFHTERTLRYFPRPIDMENLAGRLQRVSMSGHFVRTFSTEDLLIFLSVHGSKHLWDRLIWICDIAELLQRSKEVNWQMALSLADQLGSRKILQLGLYMATEFLRKDLAGRIPDFATAGAEVKPLASQVERHLFESGHGPMRIARRALFRIRTRQGIWEGLHHLLHVATAPTEEDWDSVELPRSLTALYRAIRPFRLMRDHSLRGDRHAGGRATPSTLPRRMEGSSALRGGGSGDSGSAAELPTADGAVESVIRSGYASGRVKEKLELPQSEMIRLTRHGLEFSGSENDLDSLRRTFEREHCLLLKGFLGGELVPLILPAIERAQYHPAHYDQVGSELLMEPNAALEALSFFFNDQKLFELVQSITCCGRIGFFRGRVYRLDPNPHHTFDWHNDLNKASRMLAMSLNLTAKGFQGGLLQIREAATGKMIREVANTGFGDAVLFRLSADLEHRVTPVEGQTPRISYAGWYQSEPDFHAALRQLRGEMGSPGNRA
jgi:hypothetical protein